MRHDGVNRGVQLPTIIDCPLGVRVERQDASTANVIILLVEQRKSERKRTHTQTAQLMLTRSVCASSLNGTQLVVRPVYELLNRIVVYRNGMSHVCHLDDDVGEVGRIKGDHAQVLTSGKENNVGSTCKVENKENNGKRRRTHRTVLAAPAHASRTHFHLQSSITFTFTFEVCT